MDELKPLYAAGFAVGTTLFLLALLRVGQRVLSPASAVDKDLADHNTGRQLFHVGQVAGVFLVAAASVKNCVQGKSWQHDVLWAAAFGAMGLALVVVMGRVGTQLLLRSRTAAEVERGNVAVGLAAGAHYLSAGIIASYAIAGTKLHELGLSLLFFAIAMLTQFIFVTLFRALTTYDDADQIQGENLAAALSYAGLSIGISIIVGTALDGDFTGWASSMRGYAEILVLGLALYPVRQFFVQSLLLGAPLALRGGKLDVAIGAERHEGMGALEGITYVAAALVIARLT
jgi:uncharacterized membrane protein YjfL (UPF0719 family)